MCWFGKKSESKITITVYHVDGTTEVLKKPHSFFTASWIAETMGTFKMKAIYLNYDEEILYSQNVSKFVNEKVSSLTRHSITGCALQVPKGFQPYKG
jgi:hypothetical protein